MIINYNCVKLSIVVCRLFRELYVSIVSIRKTIMLYFKVNSVYFFYKCDYFVWGTVTLQEILYVIIVDDLQQQQKQCTTRLVTSL